MNFWKKLKEKAYKKHYSDFLHAVKSRDFDRMTVCYNKMTRYKDVGVRNDGNKYFFTEILDGYVISIPFGAREKIRAMGTHFLYGLGENYIFYVPDAYPEEENLLYTVFKEEHPECEKVTITENDIRFTPQAIQGLQLSVGDIVKIWFEGEHIIIDKFC